MHLMNLLNYLHPKNYLPDGNIVLSMIHLQSMRKSNITDETKNDNIHQYVS